MPDDQSNQTGEAQRFLVNACQVCEHDFGPCVPFAARCHGFPLHIRYQDELLPQHRSPGARMQSDTPQTTVTVARWALQFVMDNACFQDKGPMPEGWRSDEMKRATDSLEKSMEEQNAG